MVATDSAAIDVILADFRMRLDGGSEGSDGVEKARPYMSNSVEE